SHGSVRDRSGRGARVNALVTDGDQRPALAITRSLGRRGIGVIVGEERATSLSSASRYCVGHVTYPSPYTSPAAFQRFLLDFIKRHRVDVVVPTTDVTTSAVARCHAAIRRRSAAAVASFDAFERVTDKWSLIQTAAACGIPVPQTERLENGGDLEAV